MKNIKHSRDTMPLPFLGLVDKPLCFGYFYSMNKLCEVCGNEFYIKPSHYNGRFCCSKKCQNIRMRGKQVKTNNPNWKGGAKFQVCAYCKKDFTPTNPYLKRKYCSHKCSSEAKKKLKRPIEIFLKAQKTRQANQKQTISLKKYYCECGNQVNRKNKKCKQCRDEASNHLKKICPNCNNLFKARSHVITFCSKRCFSEYKSIHNNGESNPNWKGGVKSKNQVGRNSKKHKEWIDYIFTRDRYTCQHCLQVGGQLQAHHIKKWSEYPMLRFKHDNGITLCIKCHKKEHNCNFKK